MGPCAQSHMRSSPRCHSGAESTVPHSPVGTGLKRQHCYSTTVYKHNQEVGKSNIRIYQPRKWGGNKPKPIIKVSIKDKLCSLHFEPWGVLKGVIHDRTQDRTCDRKRKLPRRCYNDARKADRQQQIRRRYEKSDGNVPCGVDGRMISLVGSLIRAEQHQSHEEDQWCPCWSLVMKTRRLWLLCPISYWKRSYSLWEGLSKPTLSIGTPPHLNMSMKGYSLGIGGACSVPSCESTAIAVVSWHRLFCCCWRIHFVCCNRCCPTTTAMSTANYRRSRYASSDGIYTF